MRISVTDGHRTVLFEVSANCPVKKLLALACTKLQTSLDSDTSAVRLLKDGVGVLDMERTIAQCGLAEGDVLQYTNEPAAAAAADAASAMSVAAAAASSQSSSSSDSGERKRLAGVLGQMRKEWKKPRDDRDAASPQAALPAAATATEEGSSAAPSFSSTYNSEQKPLAALLGQMRTEWKKKPKVERHFSSEQKEDEHKCAELFKMMQNPNMKRQVFESCRRLHDQYVNNPNDYEGFVREYVAFTAHLRQKQKLLDDPNSVEGQALRMEQLRLTECDRVYKYARERMPETFIPVQLLYIRIVVGGHPALACVDSAAQVSLMSLPFAKRAGLDHLIDTRDPSRISGIGGADKMEGILYCFQLMIGDARFDARANVWRGSDEMLIGLDFMRRHRCSIDLARNRLSFTETTYAEFLSDDEVIEYKKDRNDHIHHSFKVDSEKLSRLVKMGFSTADAEKALTDFANDDTDAVRYLYSVEARERRAAEVSQRMEH